MPGSVVRVAAVIVVSLAGEAFLARETLGGLGAVWSAEGPVEERLTALLVVLASAAALTGCTLWCAALGRVLLGRRVQPADSSVPGARIGWNRLAAAALGLAGLGIAPAGPALAGPAPADQPAPAGVSSTAAGSGCGAGSRGGPSCPPIRLDGLPLPGLPAAGLPAAGLPAADSRPADSRPAARHAPAPPADPRGTRTGAVVVESGDSLWSIAEARLGRRPALTAVDASWRRWYAANRSTVGPDPDLLVPGQRLRPPAPPTARKATP